MADGKKIIFRMVETDWQKPLLFDWAGKDGPPFTQEDLDNSVISLILRNEFHPPWEDPKEREARRISPKTKQKQYPRLSSLTKPQHLSGLKVLREHYKLKQDILPTPEDFQSFQEIQELYEKEEKEYRVWARNRWINGDCLRTLYPGLLVECVYNAQFKLKKNKIQTILHNNFIRAGYISFETRMDAFEFQPLEDLKSVDVQILPKIRYPDSNRLTLSDPPTFGVPKPCPEHPCQFILPHENELTALSLPEVHLELAHFAVENDAEFIASENALQCILETERDWKLTMSVVEVVCPDGGGVKKVVVLDSQFSPQKECGARRTLNAYRHLLNRTFLECAEYSKEASLGCNSDEEEQPTYVGEQQSESNSPEVQFNDQRCAEYSKEASLGCNSDEEEQPTYVGEQQWESNSPEVQFNDQSCAEYSKEASLGCNSDEEEQPTYVGEQQWESNSPEVQFNDQSCAEYSKEASLGCNSDEEEQPTYVGEQQWESNSPEVQFNDQSNSNAPSESDNSRYSPKPDRIVTDDDASVISDQFYAEEDNQSNDSSEDELQENVNDQSNSNAPSQSDISRSSSKSDRLVMADDVSVNSDQFHVEEDNQSNDSSEDEMQENVNEQQRRSTKSPDVQFNDESNSNAPSKSDISRSSFKSDRLVMDDNVSVNGDQFHAEEDNQSNDNSEDEMQENVNEQQRRSTKSPDVQFNDESNSNAPSKSDISRSSSKSDRLVMNDNVSVNGDQFHAEEDNQSNDNSEDEMQENVNEQQRRSTKSPDVQFNDESNSNAPSKSDISRSSFKSDRLVMDDDVSVNSDQFHAEEDNQSNDSREDEMQENVNEQQRRSTKTPEVQFNDESNSNAPSKSDISRSSSKSDLLVIDDDVSVNNDQFHAEEDNQSNDGSEDELQENVNEQQRRSTKSPEVQFNDESNSNAPSKSDISRSSFKSDRLVMDDDVSVNSDQFHAEEDNQSNDSREDEMQENVNEQQRRSTKTPEVQFNDESNSNAPSKSDISRSSSKSDLLVIDDDVSVNNDQFHAEEDNQSNDGSEDELQENVNEQQRRSTKSPEVQFNDQSNSNAPSQSDISRSSSKSDRLVMDDDVSVNSDQFHAEEDNQSNDSSEDEMQENVNEQQRRSTKSPHVQFNDQSIGNAPSESDISNCGSERNRLAIDDGASVPVERDHYQTKAEHSRKQSFSFYFGTDSDEEPASEEKQNNAAEEYTDIEKEKTSNQISLDTETLPTIIDNSSSKQMNDICTCTKSGEPSPRSFKKWKVANAALNRSHNIIIHASHKFRNQYDLETILEPIVEWQPELGACEQSAGRLRALAFALMMRPEAVIMNVRVDQDGGDLIMIDHYDEEKFMREHGDKRSEIADTIYKAIAQLQFLTPGMYILAHDSDKGPHAMIYTAASGAVAGGSADSSGYTLSLRPDNEKMSHAEEAAFSKIPPTLCRLVLPYHKQQEILPLAFTTDERRVLGYTKGKGKQKVNAALATTSQAKKRRNKSRKNKNKRPRND